MVVITIIIIAPKQNVARPAVQNNLLTCNFLREKMNPVKELLNGRLNS